MEQIEARTVDDARLSDPDCKPWLVDILMGDVDLDILFRTSTDDLPGDPVGADVAQGSCRPRLGNSAALGLCGAAWRVAAAALPRGTPSGPGSGFGQARRVMRAMHPSTTSG